MVGIPSLRFSRSKALRMNQLIPLSSPVLPTLVEAAGERTRWRFLEFFTANIRNTRRAYGRDVTAFLDWCVFDWLVTGQVVPANPATSVRGPKYGQREGVTPVLAPDEARQLLSAIDVATIAGLRDRALIGLMVYSFARIGAAIATRAASGAYQFPDAASFRISFSSVRSDTALRSRAFSVSSSLSRLTWSLFSPPYSWRHR
jgi:hypothetical protein